MSFIIHKKAYQDFLNLLFKLESSWQNLAQATEIEQNKRIWTELKQVFQERIINLTDENLDLEVASRWRSLQAEIQREFRLLNTDWLFWVSARQPATKQARAKAIENRLSKLISYCQVILKM